MSAIKSPEIEQEFCEALIENGGHIGNACLKVDVSRGMIRNWREIDPEFAKAYDIATELAVEALEDEVKRRAYAGVPEPVFYKGEQVSTVQKYSDLLLIFKLKALKPEKYREHYEQNISVTVQPSDLGHLEIARRIAFLLMQQPEARELDVTPQIEAPKEHADAEQ